MRKSSRKTKQYFTKAKFSRLQSFKSSTNFAWLLPCFSRASIRALTFIGLAGSLSWRQPQQLGLVAIVVVVARHRSYSSSSSYNTNNSWQQQLGLGPVGARTLNLNCGFPHVGLELATYTDSDSAVCNIQQTISNSMQL